MQLKQIILERMHDFLCGYSCDTRRGIELDIKQLF